MSRGDGVPPRNPPRKPLSKNTFPRGWVGGVVALCGVAWTCLGAASSPGPGTTTLVVWHTQDRFQATFLRSVLAEFAAAHPGTRVDTEDIVDLSAVLLKGAALQALPDVVFAPADTAGLHVPLRLSAVAKEARNPRVPEAHYDALTLDGVTYGEPVLAGNHLVFYFDKSLLPAPPASWEELATWVRTGAVKTPPARKGALGGWPFNDPYFFLPFLLSLEGLDLATAALSAPQATQALRAYHALATQGVVELDCGYLCSTSEFYRGRFAYTINGEWAFEDTRKALGARFGMAPLPAFQGRKMVSPRGVFALLFPNEGLASSKGPLLRALAAWLQSPGVQDRYAREAKRFPVLRGASLGNDAAFRTLAGLLEESAPVTPSPRMLFLWPALRKGINLFLGAGLAPEAATRVMLDTARAAEVAFEASKAHAPPAQKDTP